MGRLVLALIAVLGCKAERTFPCAAEGDCVRLGAIGACLVPGFCAFSDGTCTSGQRWDATAGGGLADVCVGDEGVDEDGGMELLNACGGRSVLPGSPGGSCGLCGLGSYQCDGAEVLGCAGEPTNESTLSYASVSASSEFSSTYEAELAVDTKLDSSWFSDGPQGTEPAIYTWTGLQERCISSVNIIGNGGHEDSNFHEGYGFGQVEVEIRKPDGTVTFSRVVQLPGEPDPDVNLEVGALGRDVVLKFLGHESNDCGGFAEMTVIAVGAP